MRRAVVIYERLIRRFTAQTTDYQVLLSTFAGARPPAAPPLLTSHVSPVAAVAAVAMVVITFPNSRFLGVRCCEFDCH